MADSAQRHLVCLTLALSGVEAGEEASRLEFGIVELISFDYRPAV
jgi:hypothetical protein